MSKSKGNGVDPVDIIHTHGADALRYSLADMATETQDIRMPVEYVCPHCGELTEQAAALKAEEQARKSRGLKLEGRLQPADCKIVRCANKSCHRDFATQWADDETKNRLGVGRESSEKFDLGRNFCTKLFNAARYALMNLHNAPCTQLALAELPPEDRWILARLSQTIRRAQENLSNYQFSASIREIREFFWDCLCDWYIELTKPRMSGDAGDPSRDAARQVLAFCLDQVLRLLHPYIPFITEFLWKQLNEAAPTRGLPGIALLRTDCQLIVADYPPLDGYPPLDDPTVLSTFALLQDATRGVRDLRMRCNVPPKQRVTVTVLMPAQRMEEFTRHAHVVRYMGGIAELDVVAQGSRPANAASLAIGTLRIFVHDISNDQAERSRAQKALAQLEKQIAGKQSRLGNSAFLAQADPELVASEQQRLSEMLAEQDSLRAQLAELES